MTTKDTNILRAIRRQLCELEVDVPTRINGQTVTRQSPALDQFLIGERVFYLGVAEDLLFAHARTRKANLDQER